MDTNEFDSSLGGSESLPFSANSLKFATARSIEIAAMTESVLRPSKTKLIFQTLPVHMRRRVMSHNSKRLPRKLREGHMEQLKKSGFPPIQKRPSRKYRRRPKNLLDEYNRRQRHIKWLETHIWHAKRFHMTERWGHRLAFAPCDKAFRACHRASSAHCLMQDISYYIPISISGSVGTIKDLFSDAINAHCGLGIAAKAFLSGNREGHIHLFNKTKYPFGYIGKIPFIWESNSGEIRKLWIFAHPAYLNQIKLLLEKYNEEQDENGVPEKRRKIDDCKDCIYKIEDGMFNRFRLTGPNSHAILVSALKCISNIDSIKGNKWIKHNLLKNSNNLNLENKKDYWEHISSAVSPSQLPPHIVIGLIVRDPRLSRPSKRTKAMPDFSESLSTEHLINIPPSAPISPFWDSRIQKLLKDNMVSNAQYIDHITKTQLVPGEVHEDDPMLQSVPIVLIQRPGSQNSTIKKVGYGSGWDILVPSGYGLIFWQTFVMFGARVGGLRETENVAFESGDCYFPPDSEAGKNEETRIETQMKHKYFSRPPSKRVNFIKLGINSPFRCHWNQLLSEWSEKHIQEFYVLRNKSIINQLNDIINKKTSFKIPQLENSDSCLIPIYLHMTKKGSLRKHAIICLPSNKDTDSCENLCEPRHEDPNETKRRQLRKEHKMMVKQRRKRRVKINKKNTVKQENKIKRDKSQPSDCVIQMRELWLPSIIQTVRNSCSRQIMGFLTNAAFSFTEAKSCGVGYITFNSLIELLKLNIRSVLVRNVSSKKYRLANFQVINS